MNVLLLLLTSLELTLLWLGAFLLLRGRGFGASGAMAVGGVAVMMGLSLLFQVGLLLGMPWGVPTVLVVEIPFTLLTGYVIFQYRYLLHHDIQHVKAFWREHPFIVTFIAGIFLYLLLQATLLPPSNWDGMTYNLARVLLFQQQDTFFLERMTTIRQAVFPVGSDILAHMWLRLGQDVGVGFSSWLSYVVIVCGVYQLGRQFAPRRVALTTALVVASLPEILLQATSIKNDILLGAIAIVCLILVARLLDKPNGFDLGLLVLFLAFGVGVKLNFAFFALPFAGIFAIPLLKKWHIKAWLKMVQKQLVPFLLTLPPAIVLSNVWLFIYNRATWGQVYGPESLARVHRHSDGLLGMVANLSRYLFESVHFLLPVDLWVEQWTGQRISTKMILWHGEIFTVWENIGISPYTDTAFYNIWQPHEDFSWFGPLWVLLILPAVIYTLFRGNNFLRGLVFSILAYVCILSLQVAWLPWNQRFFTLFFAPATVTVAYLLRQSRPWLLHLVVGIAGIILLYTATFNTTKPLFARYYPIAWGQFELQQNNVWQDTNFGQNHHHYADEYYGGTYWRDWADSVPAGATVGIQTTDETWVYPIFLAWSHVDFVPFVYKNQLPPELPLRHVIPEADYLLCIGLDCTPHFGANSMVLLQAQPANGWFAPATLYRREQLCRHNCRR